MKKEMIRTINAGDYQMNYINAAIKAANDAWSHNRLAEVIFYGDSCLPDEYEVLRPFGDTLACEGCAMMAVATAGLWSEYLPGRWYFIPGTREQVIHNYKTRCTTCRFVPNGSRVIVQHDLHDMENPPDWLVSCYQYYFGEDISWGWVLSSREDTDNTVCCDIDYHTNWLFPDDLDEDEDA